MAVIIGSARIGENGSITGGKDGDQKQYAAEDFSGEVSMQEFYVHSKGWNILRARDNVKATLLAKAMHLACNNKNIGYNQSENWEIVQLGVGTTRPCNADCGTLVRACCNYAGIYPGTFYTATEVEVLQKTGDFLPTIPYTAGTELFEGDILVTKTKGHTAIVVNGSKRLVTEKVASANYFNKKLAGNYVVTKENHLRFNAGKESNTIKLLPKGTIVKCFGYYNTKLASKWLLVQCSDGQTGYVKKKYISK